MYTDKGSVCLIFTNIKEIVYFSNLKLWITQLRSWRNGRHDTGSLYENSQ
jgi:hypothetical protein